MFPKCLFQNPKCGLPWLPDIRKVCSQWCYLQLYGREVLKFQHFCNPEQDIHQPALLWALRRQRSAQSAAGISLHTRFSLMLITQWFLRTEMLRPRHAAALCLPSWWTNCANPLHRPSWPRRPSPAAPCPSASLCLLRAFSRILLSLPDAAVQSASVMNPVIMSEITCRCGEPTKIQHFHKYW